MNITALEVYAVLATAYGIAASYYYIKAVAEYHDWKCKAEMLSRAMERAKIKERVNARAN